MGEEEHHKGVRYSDYFFLLAILFIFLLFFCLLCIGGIFGTKWIYKRRTKEKLDEEREKHRREEDAWKECERKLREEANRKNERALEREVQRRAEARESKPHQTVIKMETPTKAREPVQQQQQPVCNHPSSFPNNNGQPLVQTVFIPQPIYPPPTFPPQYFQQQQYQSYLGQSFPQQQQPGMLPLESRPQKPSKRRSPKSTSEERLPRKASKKSSKKKERTKKDARKKSKRDVESDSSRRRSSPKITETDVEFETSTPPTSTTTSIPSTPRKRTSSSKATTDSELPCLSSDFEASKIKNSLKKKQKTPSTKRKLRKISQSTTVTESRTVTETLASTSGSFYTSSAPITRTITRTTVIGDTPVHQQQQPVTRIPKTWKRRKSPELTPAVVGLGGTSSNDERQTSLTSLASPSRSETVTPTTSQSSVFTENDDSNDGSGRTTPDETATTTEATSGTPKITEVTTIKSSSPATSTPPSTTTKTSMTSPIITEPDESTEKTQSPVRNGFQSPNSSVSVEMASPQPPPKLPVKKERTKIGCRPRVAAEVVQVLAKHREYDEWRLPNERFELVNEEESPKKRTKSSSPATTSAPATTKTPSSKSPPLALTSVPSSQLDLFNTAKIAAPSQFTSTFPPPSSNLPINANRKLADSNDPFLTNNPYWRSRTERVTQIEKLRSPNTGKFNGIEVKSQETAIWLPMEAAAKEEKENKKNDKKEGEKNNNNKLPAAAELQHAQVVEIIKSDKTQESP